MQISSSMFGSLVGGVSKTPSSAGLDMSWMQAEPSKDSQSAARTEFGDYMKMSPAEKMRQLIDKQIEDMIKQEAQLAADQEGKKGLFADVKV